MRVEKSLKIEKSASYLHCRLHAYLQTFAC